MSEFNKKLILEDGSEYRGFGFGGLLAMYVAAPAISRGVGKLPPRVRNAGAMALTLTFLADFAYCMVNGFNSGAGVGEDL